MTSRHTGDTGAGGDAGRVSVEHPSLGVGYILSWQRGGREVLVQFRGQPLPRSVRVRELARIGAPEAVAAKPTPAKPASGPAGSAPGRHRPAEAAPAKRAAPGPSAPELPAAPRDDPSASAPAARLAAPPTLEGTYDADLAVMTLEAMRLGVVPSASLDAYTVGRSEELELLDGDLDRVGDLGGATRVFLGDYGTGKTHVLELAQDLALARNFLTCQATLDALEAAPSHPKRVYRRLVRSLRYPERPHEEGVGLEPLFDRAVASPEAMERFRATPSLLPDDSSAARGKALARGYHLYLSPALAHYASLSAEDAPRRLRWRLREDDLDADTELRRLRALLLDWLEGHPTISNRDIDQALRAVRGPHPKVYSLMDVRPWARIYGYLLSGLAQLARAAGYAGLVVLLDEAEFFSLLSKDNRFYAEHLFKAWSWAATGGGGAEPPPFDEEELWLGGHGILRDLPARYSDDAGLYTVFAMTPNEDGVTALSRAVSPARHRTLRPLSQEDYAALTRAVCDFYVSAHPSTRLAESVVVALTQVTHGLLTAGMLKNPREAMKFLLEFLDVVRHTPRRMPEVVRGLQEQLVF